MDNYEKMWNKLKNLVQENEKHMAKKEMEINVKEPSSTIGHTYSGAKQAFKSIRTDMEFAEQEFKEDE